MSDAKGRWEKALEDYSGWGRLLITLFFLAAQAGYFVSKIDSQAKASAEQAVEFQKQIGELNGSIKDLAGQVQRMAISNEHLSVQMLENERRIDDNAHAIEKVRDGQHR